ncbi:MAG: FAD-binding oxidoreductase [Cyanobacteriota bacterium erpe_2018_sw_21hr_WHONDRS-SW48-000092_B_bin.40]|nr:FAD-binding oxidoreductase [Cyanobacteriota bacterium erpe_2018_sw_21hr_WHONDRS-SW48-000092_B_bin.40]
MSSVAVINQAPWRDTASENVLSHLQLPSIEGMADSLVYDVAIIGGGMAGLSSAQAFAQLGASAVVLEAQPALALGASGRNAGILCAGINMPITYTPKGSSAAELWSATQRKLFEVLEEAREQSSFIDVKRVGAMCLATSKTAAARLKRETKARLAACMSAELITAAEVSKLSGGFIDVSNVLSAMMLPDEGAIHPFTLLATMANRARRSGCQIYGEARVESVEPSTGGYIVKTSNGKTIQCRAVVSAVGPLEAPTGRIFALAFKVEIPESCPVWWDANPYIYYDYRPGNGCLTVSGGRYGTPGTSKFDLQYHSKMAAATHQWVPSLAGVEPDYAWGVDLHVAPDLLPELVALGDNWLSIQGLGALGVLPGLVLGERAAKQITTSLALCKK